VTAQEDAAIYGPFSLVKQMGVVAVSYFGKMSAMVFSLEH
jgi:hypothetical protein